MYPARFNEDSKDESCYSLHFCSDVFRYPEWTFHFTIVLILDVSSHYFHFYSTLLHGITSQYVYAFLRVFHVIVFLDCFDVGIC